MPTLVDFAGGLTGALATALAAIFVVFDVVVFDVVVFGVVVFDVIVFDETGNCDWLRWAVTEELFVSLSRRPSAIW